MIVELDEISEDAFSTQEKAFQGQTGPSVLIHTQKRIPVPAQWTSGQLASREGEAAPCVGSSPYSGPALTLRVCFLTSSQNWSLSFPPVAPSDGPNCMSLCFLIWSSIQDIRKQEKTSLLFSRLNGLFWLTQPLSLVVTLPWKCSHPSSDQTKAN